MAVNVDVAGSTGLQTDGINPKVTTSITVGANGNRVLYAFAVTGVGGMEPTSVSVTFNGVSMTAYTGKVHSAGSTAGWGQGFYLINPPIGTYNLTASFSGGGNSATGFQSVAIHGLSLYNVNQQVPHNTPFTTTGSSANPSASINSSIGNLVVTGFIGGSSITAASQTQQTIQNVNTHSGAGNSQVQTAVGAANVTTTATMANDFWGAIEIDVNSTFPPYKGPIVLGSSVIGALVTTQSSGQLVRTSSGILYTVTLATNSALARSINVYKSTDNGMTWNQQDYYNAPPSAGSSDSVSAAIDGNNVIHIAFHQATTQYVQYSTVTDTYGRIEQVNASSATRTAIIVDSNNIPHIVLGGSAPFLRYNNRINGSWQAQVTVVTPSATPQNIDIQIDQNNVPQISSLNATNGIQVQIGNKNNATSFTSTTLTAAMTAVGGTSLSIDSSGNTWLAYQSAQNGLIQLAKHVQTDPWATWQPPITNGFNGKSVSLASDLNNIYVFYERNAGGIAYDRYDTVNRLWIGEQILQANTPRATTNIQFHNPFVKWSQYFNNGDTGANNTGQQTIDYLFDNGSTVYYDRLVTAQISTGYVTFSFSAPAGAFTTSTSSTSSTSSSTSTSLSTSTSSTSSSTSVSTSSTSSSTSISSTSSSTSISTSTSSTSSSTSLSTSTSLSSTSSSISTSTSSTSSSISTSSTSSSISTSSTSSSTSVSSTSSSISTSTSSTSSSVSTSSTSSSTSTSASTSTSSTSSSISTSSTSSSISTSTSSTSSSTSFSTSSTSSSTSISSTSTSTTQSFTTSTSSTSSSISTSSTSSSISTSTSSTSSSVSTSSTSSSVSTSSTSHSTSTSSTSSSTSTSLSSTSSSISTSTSSTSQSTSTSSTSSSTSFSTSSTSSSTSLSTSSTSHSTTTSFSTSSTSTSASTSFSTSSTSTSTTLSTTTSTSSTSTSTSSTSTSTTTIAGLEVGFLPRATIYPQNPRVTIYPDLNRVRIPPRL